MADLLSREIQATAPNVPVYDVKTMHDHISVWLLPARIGGTTFGFFGLVALVLTAIGNYGIITYWSSQRRREMAIRIAFGATRRDLVTMMVRHGMRLVAMGVLIGALGALAAGRVVSRFLYGIDAGDPLTFAAVSSLVALVALAASYLPARRAAHRDAIVDLRYE
jgi:ABC-type antimicrobial peptide transport system permease subunit